MSFTELRGERALAATKPIPSLAAEEFQLFRAVILRESGIHLGPKNRAMLVSRLWKRVRILELNSFAAYYRRVKADPEEMVRMLDCVCTNETHFFREPAAFDCLRQQIFPKWRAEDPGKRNRTIRAWSAGCSTGDEAYSLAMTLLDEFPLEVGWNVEVVGTDLSTKVLAKASAGIWLADKISGLPAEYQRKFLLKGFGSEKGKVKAVNELRRVVKFKRLNLTREPYEVCGPFDLIFCRNVLIYFEWEMKLKVVNRLGKHLAQGGYLFLGQAESLHGVADKLETVATKSFPIAKATSRGGMVSALQRCGDSGSRME